MYPHAFGTFTLCVLCQITKTYSVLCKIVQHVYVVEKIAGVDSQKDY